MFLIYLFYSRAQFLHSYTSASVIHQIDILIRANDK